ncbi:MAG TPA: class I SAM-dependent methyltransferase [Candidatus Tumulicola sp.]|nr:class I SAM-dependent methyltransferase [Candidatus Tumulicola sp.]
MRYAESWPWIGLSDSVQGWLHLDEAHQLFLLAKESTPERDARVVELGSWKGKSSLMLAGGLAGKANPRLYCIDPFAPAPTDYQGQITEALRSDETGRRLEIFERNVKQAGLSHIVEPVQGYSFDVAPRWSAPVDLLFIDAHHAYEAVHRDFVLWTPFVKPGGIVALHDANDSWPGPTRVALEELTPPEYGPVRYVKSLAWAVRSLSL